MYPALDVPLEEDLREFLAGLAAQGVRLRVAEEGNRQVLWVLGEAEAAAVQSAWARWQAGDRSLLASPAPSRSRSRSPQPAVNWRALPVTVWVMVACLLVFAMTWVLQDARWLAALSFMPLEIRAGQVMGLAAFADGWQAGQYWRLLTPVFLHFGLAHIAFNLLWWWELGRRIEVRRGSLALLVLLLVTGVASNLCQYFVGVALGEVVPFGGLSGVVYGLIGYIGAWNVLKPGFRYDVPPGLIAIMLAFLVLFMTGFTEWVGLGRVANAAHVGGLLAGAVWAVLAAGLSGKRDGH